MFERKLKSKKLLWLLLGLAGSGVLHFGISISIWCLGLYAALRNGPVTWSAFFYHATAAFVLFVAFVAAFVFALRFQSVSAPLTLISILAAALCFCFDAKRHNYQIQTMYVEKGCSHLYFTWWWYDDSRDPSR